MKFLSLIYIKDTKLHILQNRNNIPHKLPQIPGKCAAPLAVAVITSTPLDSLPLSLRSSSQNLSVVKPSVAKLIFLSSVINDKSLLLSDDDDDGDDGNRRCLAMVDILRVAYYYP